MELCLKTKGDERVVNNLIQMWRAETNYQESISIKRWQRSAKWLENYETTFLQEYRDKNSFFKPIDDPPQETRSFASTYAQAARTDQNNRQPTLQSDLQTRTRHLDTPRPKARKQRNPRTSTIPRPVNQQQSNILRPQYPHETGILRQVNTATRYQRPREFQRQANRERQSTDLLRRQTSPINIELDDENEYFWTKLPVQRR